jgi:hypothetical protein
MNLNLLLNLIKNWWTGSAANQCTLHRNVAYHQCNLPAPHMCLIYIIYMFFNHVYLTYTSSSTHLPWQCPLPTGSCKPFARSRKLQIELHSSLIWADYSCHSCQPQLGSPLLGAMKCSQWFMYALICMHMYRDLCH